MISSLECKIPPLIYVALFSFAAYLLSIYAPWYRIKTPYLTAVGLTVGMLGLAIAVTAAVQFKINNTTLSPLNPKRATTFVARGLFCFSRNPMYLGMLLMLTGWVLVLGGLSGVIVVPLFVAVMTKWQILPEERALQESFGKQFSDYKNEVRRWL